MKIRPVGAMSFHADNVKGQYLLHEMICSWGKYVSTSQVI
jgi:hypothetical protein